MAFCPFKVGDRIQSTMTIVDGTNIQVVPQDPEIATVTEITERGFKYDYGHAKSWIPRMGLSFAGNGEVFLDAYGNIPLNWRLVEETT